MTDSGNRFGERYPRAGGPVNLAGFACVCWWTGAERHDLQAHAIEPDASGNLRPGYDPDTGEWHLGLEWQEPRDVRLVVVRYAGTTGAPRDLRVQYWRKNWPTPAPERRPGAGQGWIGRDDPWHGEWTTVRAEKVVDGAACTFTFDPIDLPELGGRRAVEQLAIAKNYLARFRRTLKLRLACTGEQPLVTGLHIYSGAKWQEGQLDVWIGLGREASADWSGGVQAYNGYVLSVDPLDFEAGDAVDVDGNWHCRIEGKAKGVRLRILYTDQDRDSGDRTIITLRTKARSFSFLVADLNQGPIYIIDYDVFITWAEPALSFNDFQDRLAAAPKSIYDRTFDEPEQSLARAMAEIPLLDAARQESYTGLGRYVPLGVEAGRQEFALRYNGELFADKDHLNLMGRDSARLLWPGHQIRYRFATGDPPNFHESRSDTRQSALDGWLPVFVSHWLDREIEYEQVAFAALLDGPMTEPRARRGDEDIAALLRFVIRNVTHGPKRACLWLAIAPQEQVEVRAEGTSEVSLVIARGRAVPAEPVARQWQIAPYDEPCLRCVVHTGGRGALVATPYAGESDDSHVIPTAVVYTVDLEGGEAHTIELTVPFVSLTHAGDWRQVAAVDFDDALADVCAYWRRYVGAGGQIDLTDAMLSDFHKAVRVHVGISVDKDPVGGLIVVPPATWSYGACGNEACWQITMLDQAGHHDRAETYLETFLRTQGVLSLDGKFTSAEGALQGLDIDSGVPVRGGFGYNLDHGFIMQCLANHYRLSGDRAWLERVTPHLIAACDFVTRERDTTKVHDGTGQPVPEWGLLPAGHLEDNPEWQHWFAVNAHACGGMQAIADVLAEVTHPEAERLAREAAAYREDIRQAARRAMVEAPVVRLLDGTYVPHIPSRTGVRGREWGWIREAAYGALHLLEGDVFDPDAEEMTWVLKDLEDNLFVSRCWGRQVDLERYWFSHGGTTIQPNLMDLAIDYLRRGQVQHALRALFNNFGTLLYPDVRVFTEHPIVELGHGVGPFYKTSDESKALIWLRACLIWEDGDSLHLAIGSPRAWFAPGQVFGVRDMASFFGPVTYRIEAGISHVVAQVEIPERRSLRELVVHVRRPGRPAMQVVTVNGKLHGECDATGEAVRLLDPTGKLTIRVDYAN